MDYDFKKAKLFIEQHKDKIENASMGMHEDWFWTARTIFEDKEFREDLDTIERLAGIAGSYWATPVLHVEYKDGTVKTYHCHKNDEDHEEKPLDVALALTGAITKEVQSYRAEIELEEIED